MKASKRRCPVGGKGLTCHVLFSYAKREKQRLLFLLTFWVVGEFSCFWKIRFLIFIFLSLLLDILMDVLTCFLVIVAISWIQVMEVKRLNRI